MKNHIDLNRGDFEIYDFELNDFDKIAEKLDEHQTQQRKSRDIKTAIWKVAAVVMLVIGAGFFGAWTTYSSQNGGLLVNAELQEAHQFYGEMIAVKQQEIARFELDQEIFSDLEALDQAFSELQADLADDADNEEVVSAMIKNYKIKLEVLERILAEIESKQMEEGS